MEPRISFVTLGASDHKRATRFYEDSHGLLRLKTPPSVIFFELDKTWLALWPRENLAADAGVSHKATGLVRNVRFPAEVGALLSRVAEYGAKVLKPGQRTDWGGYSGYFADLDGFGCLEPRLSSRLAILGWGQVALNRLRIFNRSN